MQRRGIQLTESFTGVCQNRKLSKHNNSREIVTKEKNPSVL